MNVLMVFWGKNGGLPKFTYEMADGFVRAGHNVYTVLSEDIYNKKMWENNPKIKNTFIYTGNTKRFLVASVKMLFSNRKKLLKSLRDINFDISICTMPYPWCRYISNILKVKRKYIICHDPIAHSGASKFKSLLAEKATRGYDDCVIMTKSFIPVMEEKYNYRKRNIHYMRHGYYGYQLPLEYEDNKNDDDKVNFLFFGNIHHYKGVGILLKAYKIVSAKADNVTLTIAGKGDISEFSNELKGINVNLINRFIDDSEIAPLFSSPNRVLVLPYIDATQSGVTPIAMEYKVPVIASDTGGLKEQLFEGEIGTFFRPGDYQELAERMYEYVSNKTMFLEQKLRIEQHADQLDWKEIVAQLVKE